MALVSALIEGENMLFVNRETTVPVPRVYAIYSFPEISKYKNKRVKSNYIVMEYLEGYTLEFRWDSLNAQQRMISAQLREHMNQLRSIPSPGYYDNGPFDTEHALNKAICSKLIHTCVFAEKAEFYRKAFPIVLQGHAPVFTHGDLRRKNIIIKRRPRAVSVGASTGVQQLNREDDAFDVAIIDWEYAGWYSDYWEYATAICSCGSWDDDRHVWGRQELICIFQRVRVDADVPQCTLVIRVPLEIFNCPHKIMLKTVYT